MRRIGACNQSVGPASHWAGSQSLTAQAGDERKRMTCRPHAWAKKREVNIEDTQEIRKRRVRNEERS